jgi:hypothetical protein
MSLNKDLIVITNSQENIKEASLSNNGLKEISNLIIYALSTKELKELRGLLI